MVSVQHRYAHPAEQPQLDGAAWLKSLAETLPPTELDRLAQALAFVTPLYGDAPGLTGLPLLRHALGSASLLAGMHLDSATLIATLLHAVPDFLPDWREPVEAQFGHEVALLVQGISRMEQIRHFSEQGNADTRKKDEDAQAQTEALRQLMLAMVQDIRVVLIKLAERTQTLRDLAKAPPELQRQVAQETQGLYAPLANRLGIWQLKWELEDLSMRFLEPVLYKKIATLLDERRTDRERYIAEVVGQLQHTLDQAGIPAEVNGRPKHIYSIINKMKRKHLDFDQLYDVRAVRILVEDVEACYSALSLVHELWPPIQSEFDDYIARPKSNHYRSLHTAVMGPRALPVEVQIRTREMHQHSELGVAAHWRYKEGKQSNPQVDEKIIWLRQILAWRNEVSQHSDSPLPFSGKALDARIYVLTPQGRVIDLPQGATPVDFAYALHTDLGHRTRGAKVDGHIVPLSYHLQNAQRVEILTTKQGGPSRDWINPTLGFLKSARARAKVRNWFHSQSIDTSIAQGRAQLDKELHRLGVTDLNLDQLAQKLHFNKLDDLLAALGRSEITANRIERAIRNAPPRTPTPLPLPKTTQAHTGPASVLVAGVGNLRTKLALCCKPEPPAPIIGYVTRDRGITIHREHCPYLRHTAEVRPDRLLDAQWEQRRK